MKNLWIIDGELAGAEESGSMIESIISMTDAQRLAVVDGDIPPGQMVQVTDQGDRVEAYLGGGSGNEFWQIVGPNTYQLWLYVGGTVGQCNVNGYTITLSAWNNIGWVKGGQLLTVAGKNNVYTFGSYGWQNGMVAAHPTGIFSGMAPTNNSKTLIIDQFTDAQSGMQRIGYDTDYTTSFYTPNADMLPRNWHVGFMISFEYIA